MSSATRIPVDQAGLAKLHAALEPKSTYEALVELVEERFGPVLRAAYVQTSPQTFDLDPQCPSVGEVPSRLEADDFVEGAAAVEYHYRGKTLGLVLFDGSVAAHHSDVSELLDDHFAPALFRASYLSQTLADHRRANEQVYYLTEISKLIGELDVEMLLVNILELTSGFLGADVGSITLRNGEEYETRVDWGLPHSAIQSVALNDGTGVLDHAVEHGKPLFLTQDDLTSEDSHSFERLLVLPLSTNNEVLGSINLVASQESEHFGPERLEIVGPGVGLAAMALENALLVEIKLEREREQEQMALGQQIQQGLLPQESPEYDGLDVSGHSVAAKMIGGDYFDYFTLPDGSPGLVVADVAGKGVPAGLIMTAARAMFRGAVAQFTEPVEILTHVNNLMCAEDFGGRFVTAVFARVDLDSGKVSICAAGHEPAVLYRASANAIEEIEIRALPMGLREDPGYEMVERDIASGDILLLHTDGVNEAMDAERKQFGGERIEAIITDRKDQSAQEILEGLVTAVDEHITGVPRHDDTTLIVSRVL